MADDLEVLYGFTAALNGAADVEAVQESLLTIVVEHLRYTQAVLGVRQTAGEPFSGWLGHSLIQTRQPRYEHAAEWEPILVEKDVKRLAQHPLEIQQWIQETFQIESGWLVPLIWGVQPVGMLIIETAEELSVARRRLLVGMAQQAAVMIGVMSARLRRAKESAVQEERARIGMDIHDTVSQALFGMVFTLDGALNLLPENAETVRPELERVLHTAEGVRQDIRHLIHDLWPRELTDERFEQDLRRYAQDMLQAVELPLTFDIRGEFGSLSSAVRRSLYRICQESLTNVVHHAAATEARVCLDVYDGRAILAVRDNGRGFEPAVALAQQYGIEHFGLRGIYERARSLGGTCDIFSKPGEGSSIIVDLPIRERVENRE